MCTEFDQSRKPEEVATFFGVVRTRPLPPRRNIFPKKPVTVIGLNGGERGMAELRWGLIPRCYNGPDRKPQPHNARAETVDRLPEFRDCFRTRRCLVPADAFYEWGTVAEKKRKHRFRFDDDRLFAFAGLWDCWGEGDGKLMTCCFITGEPNELVGTVHDRMPVILQPDDYDVWLGPATPAAELKRLLRPYPADGMECVPV